MAAPKKTTAKTAGKKPARKTTKKKVVRRTKYEKAMDDAIPQWLPYEGNKRQLVPVIMEMMPSKVNRFVDLFGGTGITGVEAYKYGKCQEVIYNDLEYDMVLLLEWMYVTPITDIIDAYNAAWERWFGDIEYIELFEEDTGEYKERTGDKRGGAHVQLWRALVEHYNNNRIILWDRPEDAELTRIINAVEDKEIRRQLSEYATLLEPARNMDKFMLDQEKAKSMTEEEKALFFRDQRQVAMARSRARWAETQARNHALGDDADIFAARGDFFLPGELLFIMLNTYRGKHKWAELGRGRADSAPRSVGVGNRALGKIKTVDHIVPFLEALKRTPMSFYSHSFTEGWIEKAHERPRTRVAEERWRRMLTSLTSNDMVFIDPPYHGSNAPYNKMYDQKLEIYLFALCQLLDERNIPWMLTDNLFFENDIFKGWIENYYTYKIKPGQLKIYKDPKKKEANNMEVIVTNFKPSATRAIPKTMFEQITGKGLEKMLTWTASGERSR